jgi:hypothetical protein
MNTEQQKEVNELMAEAAYESIKFSRLWKHFSNSEIDAKAEKLAKVLMLQAAIWIENEERGIEEKSAA